MNETILGEPHVAENTEPLLTELGLKNYKSHGKL